ncbi:LysR substrate-binding domain-containing protein [Myxococcus sp. MxC21-1]|uniref:LysR substrate-binding domain-containing protein n=1 Tax=Myxococcus sp. MxC21-1 TaxID=3041439 RepID=UPI00292DC985|nr:LysR substrate-binding domain-containing protein [Myxococcus sp. MxC21-1]WNZ59034.1 LysR substrate-binding domain-containing protein [Myxococcus sp. MxC21-1]
MVLRANTIPAQVAAARAGLGKVLLPRWYAEEEGGLIVLPAPAALPVREAWLVVHRDLRDVPRVRALIEAVVAAFEVRRERLGPGGT